MRRVRKKLVELAASTKPGDPHLRTVQRRLAILNVINLLLLLSAVWAMVFKPTL